MNVERKKCDQKPITCNEMKNTENKNLNFTNFVMHLIKINCTVTPKTTNILIFFRQFFSLSSMSLIVRETSAFAFIVGKCSDFMATARFLLNSFDAFDSHLLPTQFTEN